VPARTNIIKFKADCHPVHIMEMTEQYPLNYLLNDDEWDICKYNVT
jgi:hypothetical protein